MKQLKDKKIEILGVKDISEPGDMPIKSWAPIHTGTLWAYVRQLSAKEYYSAAAIQSGEEMLFIINWRDDIKSTTNKIKYKDRYYNIKRISKILRFMRIVGRFRSRQCNDEGFFFIGINRCKCYHAGV